MSFSLGAPPLLAHALNNGADAVTSALLAVDVALFAWFMHVRRKPDRSARRLRLALPPLLVVVLVGAVTATSWVPKQSTSTKAIDTNARLEFVSPKPGDVIHGSKLTVELKLTGGRLVPVSDTRPRPDAGHVHLFVDDRIVSMVNGLKEELSGVMPGQHSLRAEFVMANHRPWRNPVSSSVPVQVAP
jgi:hypothetical protein